MIPPADPLSGDVLTFVDLSTGPPDDDAAIRSHRVVVGVGGPPTAGLTAVCDEADVEVIRANVAANPRAAYTLSGLLRIVEHLDVHDGLVAESLAYSTLLAGPEFARWLATRPTRPPAAEPDPVLLDRDGDRLTITLNRPHRRNALSAAMRDALVEALQFALLDDTLTEVVLTGAGQNFCSGGDLDEFGTAADPASAHLVRTLARPAELVHRLGSRVRVHVHGACLGAGAEIPAFAAHVVASADATFGLPELTMGLVPGAGGTVGLTGRIGRHRTAWLVLTGRRLDAASALRWGLVDELVTCRSPESGQ